MMDIYTRYAQAKAGQRLHIVPELGGDSVARTALCGKHVEHWRMTINVPLANCCRNCTRVNRLNGLNRAKSIIIRELEA